MLNFSKRCSMAMNNKFENGKKITLNSLMRNLCLFGQLQSKLARRSYEID